MLRRWAWMAMLFLTAAPLPAQLSPGPLSRPHASLEGSTNCLKCHEPSRGVSAPKCLDCHTALKQRVAARQGLHARPGHQKCESCHNEHHGKEFQLVYWGKAGQNAFDHRQTGFQLVGAHAAQPCRACHKPAFQRTPGLQAGKANPSRTFLGLSPGCLSCHRDEHRGQLGTTGCLNCHTMASWQKRTFDHSKTSFPLTGQHQSVSCASCHPSRPDSKIAADPNKQFTAFKGLRHAKCSDCHRDPHQGRFGATCQQCHSTAGWRTGAARAGFDHSKTRFPLRGKHQEVSCQSCHTPGRPMKIAKFDRCADCHRDPHAGQLTQKTCESCHSVAGFSPSRFTLQDHQKTRYPLEGAHLAVPCNACHKPIPDRPGRIIQLRFPSTSCATCHGDPHKGEVQRFVSQGGCETCHSNDTFTRAIFDHDRTRFPLEGGHQRVACRSCHPVVDRGTPRERTRFQNTPTACGSCHNPRSPRPAIRMGR